MSFVQKFLFWRGYFAACVVFFGVAILSLPALAQNEALPADIDPRLVEIVEIVRKNANAEPSGQLRAPSRFTRDDMYLDLIDELFTASYSLQAEDVAQAARDFKDAYNDDASLGLSQVHDLFLVYAQLLSAKAPSSEKQASLTQFTDRGNWFERYMALSLSAIVHSTSQERQAALQKAQLALSIIPTKSNPENEAYVSFAKADVVSLIAHLHNLQGNSDLALTTSLEYLRLTKDEPDLDYGVDLINNLIYSYSIGRDHKAQLYLSEQLLEIEKVHSSSVAGLSEMRVAIVMNSVARFQEALSYADRSIAQATTPIIIRNSRVNKAIALAGLGRFNEARETANLANVNLSTDHMLNTETREEDLYLAFLFAQAEDPKYATKLFNRQLDVNAQAFLANNSRNTTAMLAELENSRERQAEREKASLREAELQALTIDRQRNLNRTLTLLTLLLSIVAIGSFLFMKSREKLMRKLEIKTVEAASAEKLKTEFLGMISHELRTPLNGIIGISDFLANYHEDPDIREKTGIVLRSGNELLSVVESLTDMARLDAGQLKLAPHDADLSLSLAEVPDLWLDKAEAKGLVFTHFIDPAIAVHNVDEDRVLQCLSILLENAVRFTESGRIHLHITGQNADQDGLTGLTAIVADTGQGMSDVVQSRLFKPFMQADTSRKRTHMGTGLNLAIAYALAKMMGGNLTVNSREGRGSEFKLDIPLADSTGNVEKIESVLKVETFSKPFEDTPVFADLPILDIPVLDGPDAPQREVIDLMKPNPGFPSLHDVEELVLPTPKDGQQRILVVDDVDSNRDVLRLILESQGHLCSEAADGFAALSKLERQNFDVMVLDIHMTPLDGVETLHRLRGSGESYANIPVVALTADNAASTNAACMDAGADLFLTKPVRQDDLLRAISYLSQTQSTRILSQQG
ncbi:MAG: response regulator [Litorimonas sp.]